MEKYSVAQWKGRILDIEGSLEIHNKDLENGELPFKIGTLKGDLILIGKGKYKKSILPIEMEGDLIIEV